MLRLTDSLKMGDFYREVVTVASDVFFYCLSTIQPDVATEQSGGTHVTR